MPAPSFRSATSNNTGTLLSFPVAKPAGVVDGDLLIVVLNTYDQSGTMAHGTPPTGWTTLRQINGTNMRSSVYWKIAASEPTSWTFTKTNDGAGYGGVIACVAVSNPAAPSTPFASENGASATPPSVAAPSVTCGSSTDLLVYIGVVRSAVTWTPPSGYTEQVDQSQGAQGLACTADTKASGASGATGTVTGTATGASGVAAAGYLLAVSATSPVTTPVADFTGTPTTGTAPLSVAFTDSSTNTPTSWAWTFGDGGTSTSQNPTHSYTTPGTYTVALVATNGAGSNTKTRTGYVTVGGAPVADFTGTPTSGTASLSVAFTDTSTSTPTSWAWTFGDGGTSTSQSPTHSYTTSGVYTVTLVATNTAGNSTKTRTNYVTVTETISYATGGGITIY